MTVNGPVTIRRRRYASATGCGVSASTPADQLLDQASATVSLGVREMCARLNAGASSFAKAAANLKRAAQLPISRERLRQIVEHDGKLALALSQRGELAPTWNARDCAGPQGQSLVYLSSDGFMVPLLTDAEKRRRRAAVLQKRRREGRQGRRLPRLRRGADQRYKEAKAVAFYDHDMTRRQVSVTLGNCNEAGRLMRRDAARISFARADQRVGNIDGGPWIINQIHKRRLPMTTVGLDFYHLGENVHKARRTIFGDDDSAGHDRAGQLLHTVKHQGFGPFWDDLLALRQQHCRSKTKRSAADSLINYVVDRRDMLDYPRFLEHGWRIGSGPMESQCRVLPHRLKGPGKRWDPEHAHALMALEAVDQSNLWPTLWSLRLHHPN
jgi:hypothetical protein